MTRKKDIGIRAGPEDQISLAINALNKPSDRARFLYDPIRYAKKENLELDPGWVKVIEEEFYKLNKHLFRIEGRFQRKT